MLAFFLAGTEALGLQAGTETLEVQGGCGESKDPWPECAKPTKKFEHIMNTQPGKQWPEAGGYCGAWSTQRAAMEKGAWISQQQVPHAIPDGQICRAILTRRTSLAATLSSRPSTTRGRRPSIGSPRRARA